MFWVFQSCVLYTYLHRLSLLEDSCFTMHLCLAMASGALVRGGVGGEGVMWTGLAGVVVLLLLCYIISDKPSCAWALFSSRVKWCEPSRAMGPPVLVRVGSGLEHRSVNGLTPSGATARCQRGSEANWNGQNMKRQHQTSLFRHCVAMAAQLLCCQKPWSVMIMHSSNKR